MSLSYDDVTQDPMCAIEMIEELEEKLEQKDAEIERLKDALWSSACGHKQCAREKAELEAVVLTKEQEYNHMQHVLSLRNGWAEVERLEAVVQELAENAAEYYMVSVKDAIKLATERVKAKQSG